MVKRIFVSAALLIGSAVAAQSATLVAFDGVSGTSVPGTLEAPGVTGFDLGRSVGVVENTGSTFNSRDWEEGTDKLSALVNNNAIFWGFTTTIAYDLTSVELAYDRSNTGPVSISIDLFVNNVFQGEIFADTDVSTSGETALIDLSAFDAIEGSVFFRLLGWGATSSLGTFDIEDKVSLGAEKYGIVISGEAVPAVPLPAGLPLLLGGVGVLAMARRAKRRG